MAGNGVVECWSSGVMEGRVMTNTNDGGRIEDESEDEDEED